MLKRQILLGSKNGSPVQFQCLRMVQYRFASAVSTYIYAWHQCFVTYKTTRQRESITLRKSKWIVPTILSSFKSNNILTYKLECFNVLIILNQPMLVIGFCCFIVSQHNCCVCSLAVQCSWRRPTWGYCLQNLSANSLFKSLKEMCHKQ